LYRIINKKKLFVTRVADLAGNIILFPKLLFKKEEKIVPAEIKEILVIRTAYIGDVVMTLPILKPLKGLYPNARITFLTSLGAKDIFLNNPYVDEVLAYDAFWFYPKRLKEAIRGYGKFLKILRSKKYDMVIEARADIRDILLLSFFSKARYRVSYRVGGGGYLLTHVVPYEEIKHRVDYHLDIVKYLGAGTSEIEWGLYLGGEEAKTTESLFIQERINSSELLVGIHPGGRKELKSWKPERFAELADKIIDKYGAKVIFTGSPQEEGRIEKIKTNMSREAVNLSGKTNLRLLSGIIKKLHLFICNDSAPLHIASAMKIPTVAIFGPSKRMETGPYGNVHRVVEKDFPCRFTCDEDVCNYKVFNECMDKIQVEDVWDAAQDILEKTKVTR